MAWPSTMPDLGEEDFVHGHWSRSKDIENRGQLPHVLPPEQLHACESQCCLVGWVRNAFGLCANPTADFPKEAQLFLEALCENMGRPLRAMQWREGLYGYPHAYQMQIAASDAFEGSSMYPPRPPISAKQAARAWAKTLLQFDFVEDAEWFV